MVLRQTSRRTVPNAVAAGLEADLGRAEALDNNALKTYDPFATCVGGTIRPHAIASTGDQITLAPAPFAAATATLEATT